MIDLRQQFYPVQWIDNELALQQLASYILSITSVPITSVPIQSVPIQSVLLDTASVDHSYSNPSSNIECKSKSPSQKESILESLPLESSPLESSPYFINKGGDSLFWAIYVAVHGLPKFNSISHNLQRYEIEYKKQIIQQIQEDGKSFKLLNHKITNINIQEMMSELSVSKVSTLLSVYAYATAYKQNIYIVYPNHTYMSILHSSESNVTDAIIIYYMNKYKCGFDQCTHPKRLDKLMETHVGIETPENPLKSMSNYKLSDLTDMASKLNIGDQKMKKQELYDMIRERCYSKM